MINLRKYIRQTLNELEDSNSENITQQDYDALPFSLKYPVENTLVRLNIDKVLLKHQQDHPDYSILSPENRIGNRVERAEEFIKNYIKDRRWIHQEKGRMDNMVDFYASIIGVNNNKIDFTDGRHRVMAAKNLGLKYAYFEVPKKDKVFFETNFN